MSSSTSKENTEVLSEFAESAAKAYATICRLRAPDGCPWDREQTPESLRESVLEEAYETVEAIESGDSASVREELGDLLLLVLMIGRIFEERGEFTASRIADELNQKLIRRHPHVFGDSKLTLSDPAAVVTEWNRIKVEVEGKPEKSGVLDRVSAALPALQRAFKMQKKAARVGFDWPDHNGVRAKLHEEVDELCDLLEGNRSLTEEEQESDKDALKDTISERMEGEIGDLLFSVVNLARTHRINPTLALDRTNRKFLTRFQFVEQRMQEASLELSAERLTEMESFWKEAKSREA